MQGIIEKTKPKYLIDEKGNKKAVVLDIKEYKSIMELIEDLEDANDLPGLREKQHPSSHMTNFVRPGSKVDLQDHNWKKSCNIFCSFKVSTLYNFPNNREALLLP